MTNERLSDWLDGELTAVESRQVVNGLTRQSAQQDACGLYWLIGDCLRGDLPATGNLSVRVMAALDAEPVVLAPGVNKPRISPPVFWMPVAAAAAGVAVAVWMGLGLWAAPFQETPAAFTQQTSKPTLAVNAKPEVLPDERGYLMAHQASGMGVSMTGVAQYIRTVSVEQESVHR